MRRKAREAEKNARQAIEAGKARTDDATRRTQEKYGDIKATAKGKVEETGQELTERARQSAYAAQAKLDEYKSAAEKSLVDARKASERKYEETKDTATQKAEEAKNSGWRLFGFGSQKAEETKKEVAESTK
ncbi:hypothetical protein ID866_5038 [Astraeus odoratus]|nr:hypothetical protein ID866_5038 [Astraeus odoratus]